VPAKTASTSGMQRALHKSCVPPGLLANVLLAGERRFVAQLHWPGPARRQPWRAISSCLVSRTGDRPVGGAASASFPFPQKIPRFPSQTGSPSQALQRCPTPRSRVRWITKLCATRHKEIAAMVALHPYRKECYRKVAGGKWQPVPLAHQPRDYEERVEREPFDEKDDFVRG